MTVTRTERGWPGHFRLARSCLFRRNTLVECGDVRIVVSTVGRLLPFQEGDDWQRLGDTRYFETMAFRARQDTLGYWDADVSEEVPFSSPWTLSDPDAEREADAMHETVVAEIMTRLKDGDHPQSAEPAP